MLKFLQLYSAKNTPRDAHKIRKPLIPQLETFKKRKIKEKNRKNFMKVSGKSHSAENYKESCMFAKRFVSS